MSDLENIAMKGRRQVKLHSGETLTIKLLRTTVGLKVARRLLKLIAPTVGSAIDGVRHDEYLHGAPKSFSHLASILCTQIDEVKIEELMLLLLEEASIGKTDIGNAAEIDDYFQGNYGELIEVLEFALKENFSTFFTGRGIKARLTKAVTILLAQMSPESQEQ